MSSYVKISKLIPKGFHCLSGDDFYSVTPDDSRTLMLMFFLTDNVQQLKFSITKTIHLLQHISTQLDKGKGY